jgi:hypothetical protein
MSYRMGGIILLPMNFKVYLLEDVSQLVHGVRLLQSSTVGKLPHKIELATQKINTIKRKQTPLINSNTYTLMDLRNTIMGHSLEF